MRTMKKIINGRLYDTKTAKTVGEYEYSYPTDFNYYHETLYRKRTGEYFIFGWGNAASKYAERVPGGAWKGSEEIIPLTYENARSWAETSMEVEDYEAEFGEVSEGDTDEDVKLSLRVSAKARARLERYCAKTGQTKGQVVSSLLESLS